MPLLTLTILFWGVIFGLIILGALIVLAGLRIDVFGSVRIRNWFAERQNRRRK